MGEPPGPCWLIHGPRSLFHRGLPAMSNAASATPLPSQKTLTTTSPSVAGVDEAMVFSWCVLPTTPPTDRCHSVLPLAASKHTRERSVFVAVWTNTRSPHTMGDELPRPGRAFFHKMPFSALKATGTALSSATPVPLGPRKRGQLSADAASAVTKRTTTETAWRNWLCIRAVPGGMSDFHRVGGVY